MRGGVIRGLDGIRKIDKRSALGKSIEDGLKEALAWKRGELALETVNVDPMPAQRIRSIRKKVAKSVKDFERPLRHSRCDRQ